MHVAPRPDHALNTVYQMCPVDGLGIGTAYRMLRHGSSDARDTAYQMRWHGLSGVEVAVSHWNITAISDANSFLTTKF
jgi:hypothetical protein